jgi:hypothetical protein
MDPDDIPSGNSKETERISATQIRLLGKREFVQIFKALYCFRPDTCPCKTVFIKADITASGNGLFQSFQLQITKITLIYRLNRFIPEHIRPRILSPDLHSIQEFQLSLCSKTHNPCYIMSWHAGMILLDNPDTYK